MDNLPLENMFRDTTSCKNANARVISWKGNAYAAFFRGNGEISPVFNLPQGTYRSEWVNILTGESEDAETFSHEGGNKSIKVHICEGSGGALRVIRER